MLTIAYALFMSNFIYLCIFYRSCHHIVFVKYIIKCIKLSSIKSNLHLKFHI